MRSGSRWQPVLANGRASGLVPQQATLPPWATYLAASNSHDEPAPSFEYPATKHAIDRLQREID